MLRTVDLKIRKKEPTGPAAPPVKRCLKVKFKLTIQSENLRFNSKCFYHYKANYKW